MSYLLGFLTPFAILAGIAAFENWLLPWWQRRSDLSRARYLRAQADRYERALHGTLTAADRDHWQDIIDLARDKADRIERTGGGKS